MTNTFLVDIETYSEIDLTKAGVYRYVEDPSFQILLFAYKINNQPTVCLDLTKDELPYDIYQMLHCSNIKKIAHNANFERTCLAKFYGEQKPENWMCTMSWAMSLGLPAKLENVGEVLNLNIKKDKLGKTLINFFSKPCKPTKINGMRTKNLPMHAPEKWRQFINYCVQDVDAEYELYQRLSKQPMPDSEHKFWCLDQKINDTGVRLKMELVNNAIKLNNQIADLLLEDAKKLTGLENPNSVAQLKKWLELQGVETESLNKKAVKELISENKTDEVIQALEIRQQLSKSSIKKYVSMANGINLDHRARGLFQFYGASRTGRWCLAEGSEIKIKDKFGRIYNKCIELVLKTDQVWDGETWVNHEGVVFSGDKEVIEWDGIKATPEHLVWINADTKITLKEAKNRRIPLWKGNTLFIN
jgi:DNA polymerase